MSEIRVVDVSTLPKETQDFKGISLPFYKGKTYGVMDLDAYQAHLTSVVGGKMKQDAGLALKFVGFTDTSNINTSDVNKSPNPQVYFSNAKKQFVFKDGVTFYLKHETLSATYNEGSTVRQDKIFLNKVVLYSYDSSKGGIMAISDVEIVDVTGQSTTAVMSQKGVTNAIDGASSILNNSINKVNGKAEEIKTQLGNTNTKLSQVSAQVTQNTQSISNKVDKVEGKGLSSNDYTTAEKSKLSGIEEGAQKNSVTSTPTGRVIADIDQTLVNNALRKTEQILSPQEQIQVQKNIAKGGYMQSLLEQAGMEWHPESIAQDGTQGAYWLNGIKDITIPQAERIYINRIMPRGVDYTSYCEYAKIRTPLFMGGRQASFPITAPRMFLYAGCEIIEFAEGYSFERLIYGFFGESYLKVIKGLAMSGKQGDAFYQAFRYCNSLETLEIRNLYADIDLSATEVITKESLNYIITNSSQERTKTITLYPSVYAKVQNSSAEWGDIYSLAQTKKVTLASA